VEIDRTEYTAVKAVDISANGAEMIGQELRIAGSFPKGFESLIYAGPQRVLNGSGKFLCAPPEVQ
jgi:hypothetical protein